MIDEVHRSGLCPDVVVLSVGGGGLLSGVVEGLQRHAWRDVPVLGVETWGAESFHRSVQANQVVELEQISSVAKSLGAKRVCDQALACTRIHPIQSVVVSDHDAVSACRRFLDDHRLLVEPACGASLSLAYAAHPALLPYKKVLMVVCGGATCTLDGLLDDCARTAIAEGMNDA